MICLGIDTTGAACSAALVDEARVLASASQIIHRGHAEVLGPMVQDLLKETDIVAKNLSKISACTGPGSFTGLRVGLSFAKGLALPWAIPVVGVSGLEVLARAADPQLTKSVLAIADVRRGEVFWQRFVDGQAQASAHLSDVAAAKKALQPHDMIVGNGAALMGGAEQDGIIDPIILAWIGSERTPETHPAEPLYHRPPDAKLPGGRSL